MTMWLPDGWWIITEVTNKGTRFTAGASGLPEIESSAKFRSDREATSIARKALRSMAYENKKYFRYVSFNSERIPEVNSEGENHALQFWTNDKLGNVAGT